MVQYYYNIVISVVLNYSIAGMVVYVTLHDKKEYSFGLIPSLEK